MLTDLDHLRSANDWGLISESKTILIVDDNPTNLQVLSESLIEANLEVAIALDGESALEQVKYRQPALILLDVMMEGIDGFETCKRLKADPISRHIPVIFMTALTDVECKVKGLALGAVDYITKPFQRTEVLARVQAHLQLQQFATVLEQQNRQLRSELLQWEIAEAALQDLNQALRQQRDLAQITLQSIADGVITTDALGQIQTLNPVAAQLTGWSEDEAKGHCISRVFQVVDEKTLNPQENLVEQVLREKQRIVYGKGQRVLVARDGSTCSIDASVSPIQGEDGRIEGAVLVFRDVTIENQMAKQLSWQASYDALTQLVNRRELERLVTEAIAEACQHHHTHCLCFIDLDRFKIVNDVCGHAAGDELLRQVSHLLSSHVRKTDTVARVGGDEFAILFRHCSIQQAEVIAEELATIFEQFRFVYQGNPFQIGLSLGLVEITGEISNLTNVLSAADAACYAAKKRGGRRFHVYRNSDQEIAEQQQDVQWIVHLNRALENNLFCLHYQPIVALQKHTGSHKWYEVLLRMMDRDGEVLPGAFMPAAERYGLMPKLDRWVIQTLFSSHQTYLQQTWLRCQKEGGSYRYMINLSGCSLNDDQFASFVEEQLHKYQIPPQLIGFEITETVAIANFSRVIRLIQRLKALGCHFALDDFGSGMSSFNYLKNLPVDYLKIDGSLVRESVSDPIALTIVESIHRIGHIVGIQTIAEFIESDAIRNTMTAIGINYGQGYLFGQPQAKPLQACGQYTPLYNRTGVA